MVAKHVMRGAGGLIFKLTSANTPPTPTAIRVEGYLFSAVSRTCVRWVEPDALAIYLQQQPRMRVVKASPFADLEMEE